MVFGRCRSRLAREGRPRLIFDSSANTRKSNGPSPENPMGHHPKIQWDIARWATARTPNGPSPESPMGHHPKVQWGIARKSNGASPTPLRFLPDLRRQRCAGGEDELNGSKRAGPRNRFRKEFKSAHYAVVGGGGCFFIDERTFFKATESTIFSLMVAAIYATGLRRFF